MTDWAGTTIRTLEGVKLVVLPNSQSPFKWQRSLFVNTERAIALLPKIFHINGVFTHYEYFKGKE